MITRLLLVFCMLGISSTAFSRGKTQPPPPAPPPPSSYSVVLKSNLISRSNSGNLASLNFSDKHFDPSWCSTNTYNYNIILDSSVAANQPLLNAYSASSGQGITISLTCPSLPVVTTTYDAVGNAILSYQYPSGCKVASYTAGAVFNNHLLCY